jgi:hypothetical protein
MAPLPKERLDRLKTDADIAEHVLEGVQTDSQSTHVQQKTDVSLRPWIGGFVASGVQVQVIEPHDPSDRDEN